MPEPGVSLVCLILVLPLAFSLSFFKINLHWSMAALGLPDSSAGKESAHNEGDLGWRDPLELGMATHSSILAWRIPIEEPGRLQSMGSQRVRRD